MIKLENILIRTIYEIVLGRFNRRIQNELFMKRASYIPTTMLISVQNEIIAHALVAGCRRLNSEQVDLRCYLKLVEEFVPYAYKAGTRH